MALSERTLIDQISADEFANVSVRQRLDILRDDAVVSSSYHRWVLGPKDSLTNQDERVARIARAARKGALPLPKPEPA